MLLLYIEMDLYNRVSQQAAELVTKSYSTSFSMAVKLTSDDIKRHIYNIYGLVRIADEIVDSYDGNDRPAVLNQLEAEVYTALHSGYSTNVIVQAFMLTACEFGIKKDLIKPFFSSMRVDISKKTFTRKQYEDYIYGSAEVVGLMCLKVFCPDNKDYQQLRPGAQALGSAFQKVNFLRDFADDYHTLGRCYFPGTTFASFDQQAKDAIITDIEKDFATARSAVAKLPPTARPAVNLALKYYSALLEKLIKASPEDIKQQRYRISDGIKLALFARIWTAAQLHRGQS